jgi:hypothetical protein
MTFYTYRVQGHPVSNSATTANVCRILHCQHLLSSGKDPLLHEVTMKGSIAAKACATKQPAALQPASQPAALPGLHHSRQPHLLDDLQASSCESLTANGFQPTEWAAAHTVCRTQNAWYMST